MGHTKIKGIYYVKRSTHRKTLDNYTIMVHELNQLTAHYSELKMSFEKCAEENKQLKKAEVDMLPYLEELYEIRAKPNYTTKEVLMFYFAGALFGSALFAAICFSFNLNFAK